MTKVGFVDDTMSKDNVQAVLNYYVQDGKEIGQRDSIVAAAPHDVSDLRAHTNAEVARDVVSKREVCLPMTTSLFLDSDGEDGEPDDIATQCLTLQQQLDQMTVKTKARYDSPPCHSTMFGQILAQSEESDRASFHVNEIAREQTQLHRLLGDYMLTAKGDRIMAQMEEAVRDVTKERNAETLPSPLNSETAKNADADLASLLESMEDFAQYIAEN